MIFSIEDAGYNGNNLTCIICHRHRCEHELVIKKNNRRTYVGIHDDCLKFVGYEEDLNGS